MCAFYDAIPMPASLRNFFVLRKGNKTYSLKTIPTGARWSVCVAQGITWSVVDFPLPPNVVVFTMIDNILVAAPEGSEVSFIHTLKTLASRLQKCNMQTEPSVDFLTTASTSVLLQEAAKNNTFLGEEYVWNSKIKRRETKNSIKTIAKIELTSKQEVFTFRTLASYISLLLFAMHTVHFNPACAFFMLRLYRGIGVEVSKRGGDAAWDEKMDFICDKGMEEIKTVTKNLLQNLPSCIPPHVVFTSLEKDYDDVFFIDASASGWAAIRHKSGEKLAFVYQQRWVNILGGEAKGKATNDTSPLFSVHHSAHAEPWAVKCLLSFLLQTEENFKGRKIAMVTDHQAIVQAQKKTNGYGGIGRGHALNSMFFVANTLPICFFYIAGELNPADPFSRHFEENCSPGKICCSRRPVNIPFLSEVFSPLVEEADVRPKWMR